MIEPQNMLYVIIVHEMFAAIGRKSYICIDFRPLYINAQRAKKKHSTKKKKQQHESTKIVTEMCPCPSPLFAHVVRKQTHTRRKAGKQAHTDTPIQAQTC